MFMIYLVLAIVLGVGTGVFTQYDKEMRQSETADQTEIEVATEMQARMARSIRRQFNIDPTAFPTVAPGQFVRLSDEIVGSASIPGYFEPGKSDYYLDSNGFVFAVLMEGRTSLVSENGDFTKSVHGPPNSVPELARDIFANDTSENTPDSQAQQPDSRAAGTLTEDQILSLPDTEINRIGRIADNRATRVATSSRTERPDDGAISLDSRDRTTSARDPGGANPPRSTRSTR